MKRSTILSIVFLIGVIHVSFYFVSSSIASLHDGVAIPQVDTSLYCQAARRIVEGYPFSFSEGEAPTTGTTSVLYPFVLAILYLLGAHGDSLLTAGFFVNATFYLVFLLSWTVVFFRWFRHRNVAILGSLLVALTGQPAFCAMAQSDTGMWMCASSLFVAGLSVKKRGLWGPLLILLPWIRPEGILCLVSLIAVFALSLVLNRKHAKRNNTLCDGGFLAFGCLSVVALFVVNRMIAGSAQFSSVSGKGYLAVLPFAAAVTASAQDALTILCQFFMGLTNDAPRCFVVFPFLAGICVVASIIRGEWRIAARRGFLVCIAMLMLDVGLVASSSWQGSNCDRYLAWVLPVGIAFIAEGAYRIVVWNASQLVSMRRAWFVLSGLLVLFGVMSSGVYYLIYYQTSKDSDRRYAFSKECDACLPDNASIGTLVSPGVAYGMKARRVAHLYGIYSNEFLPLADHVNIYETLKREDMCRFDYWFLSADPDYSRLGLSIADDRDRFLGKTCLVGPDGLELRKADWTVYENSNSAHVETNYFCNLMARVDVGYVKDERLYSYSVEDRYNRDNKSSLVVSMLDGKRIFDGCRIITGLDKMKVPLQPGKDVKVVMRTFAKLAKGEALLGSTTDVSFANPLKLNMAVNGNVVGCCELKLHDNGFTDAEFRIPGECITDTPCEVAFLGDHAVGGYWFYQ